jgi:hypothetical protein
VEEVMKEHIPVLQDMLGTQGKSKRPSKAVSLHNCCKITWQCREPIMVLRYLLALPLAGTTGTANGEKSLSQKTYCSLSLSKFWKFSVSLNPKLV